MELTEEMKEKMSFLELDKTYMPGQERLPVVAYQIVKQVIGFIVGQHLTIKRLDKEIVALRSKIAKGGGHGA